MKIALSQPSYKLDRKALRKDLLFIRQMDVRRFIRRRVPFFMDGYRYAARAVRKRWGISFCFFESGHEQVKPVYLPIYLDTQAAEIWWQKMHADKKFARNLVRELLGVVTIEKGLARSIPQRGLSSREIIRYLRAHLAWWVRFFEVAFLWFAVENLQEKVNKEINQFWLGSKQELARFIEAVYRPMKLPASSREQRDLLRLHELRGTKLERALKRHWRKYRHLALHNIDDEYFDLDYYRGRLALLKRPAECRKQKVALEAADKESLHANLLIQKAKLPFAVKERINFVRWFMYLRTETVDHMMLVNGAYKSVFASLSGKLSLPVDALLHMTYKELIASLHKGHLSIPRELVFEREKGGYAYLIAPHGSFLVTGKDVDKLYHLVVPETKITKATELQGQVAFRGQVRGVARVIIDRRNAHELKAGEVLVTTMTSPEFVPAMRIAAGIITNEGGILSHAAIMSRELRKPCIIGTKIATDVVKTGDLLEVDANNGTIKIVKKTK